MSSRSILRRVAVVALAAAACGSAVPAASAAVPQQFFGIFAEAPAEADFDAMAEAGFGAYRLPMNWARIQPSRDGPYEWSHVDRQLQAVVAAGMEPLPVVYGTPPFVHPQTEDPGERIVLHPPRRRVDLIEWRRFNAALARRYGPHGELARDPALPGYRPVRTWIIWNEQNATVNWQPRPDPRQYARLVKFAHAGLSRVNTRAEVVLGGMFGYPLAPRSIKAAQYLRQLYRVRGFERRFDAINVHPYAANAALAIEQIRKARKVIRHAGDGRTPIIVGEIGWSSLSFGQDGQARRHERFLGRVLARRHRWRIEAALIYVWRDTATATVCVWCPTAGLVDADGAPKLALARVGAIIAAATARGR
jgi:hypothetical protein